MSAERFEPAARVIRESWLARGFGHADAALRTAAVGSRAAGVLRSARRPVEPASDVGRIRFWGTIVLAAAVTNAALQPLVSQAVRAVLPLLADVESIALSAAVIALAPAIARAWPRSRLHRLLGQRADFNS